MSTSTASVSIVIPTLRRPGPLACALASAQAQTGVSGVEIVVVDNDPEGSARAHVEQAKGPFPVRYISVPEPGIANARNAGVAASKGALIAFLDDDEDAPAHWLRTLMKTRIEHDADAVFGPVCTRLPEHIERHRAYFLRFFGREGPSSSGSIDHAYGCGNSLVVRAALPSAQPFSAARNTTGGEDDLLFATMKAKGARFAWAAEAFVWEEPVTQRVTLAYTLKRAFAYGQGPCSAAFAAGPKRWPLVPLWSLVGVAQALGWSAIAAFRAATGGDHLAEALDAAARGLGKLLWFPPFKIGFYGQGTLVAGAAKIARGPAHDRHQPLERGAAGDLRQGEPRLRSRPA